jgi:hypothetical protein
VPGSASDIGREEFEEAEGGALAGGGNKLGQRRRAERDELVHGFLKRRRIRRPTSLRSTGDDGFAPIVRFAIDSPLEEAGFELSVPRDTTKASTPPHVASASFPDNLISRQPDESARA